MTLARSPLIRLLLDGTVVPGVIAVDLFGTSQLAADRFRVRLAAQSVAKMMPALLTPGARLNLQGSANAAGEGWVGLLVGQVDDLSFDPVHGIVDLEGRDLGARLIEAQVGETFANQTSSEIVQTVAARHGLSADVTETGTPVGRYYQDQHERLTLAQYARSQTEWDLLAWLAAQEGFLLGMLDDRLQFGPRDATVVPISIQDCISVEAAQQVALLRPIEITVRSWGTRAGALVEQKAISAGTGPTLLQTITRPNLSADQALALAQRVLADLQLHVRTVRLSMPGDFLLSTRNTVGLSGVGAAWDGAYTVGSLNRHLDIKHGFTQTLELQTIPGG